MPSDEEIQESLPNRVVRVLSNKEREKECDMDESYDSSEDQYTA